MGYTERHRSWRNRRCLSRSEDSIALVVGSPDEPGGSLELAEEQEGGALAQGARRVICQFNNLYLAVVAERRACEHAPGRLLGVRHAFGQPGLVILEGQQMGPLEELLG